MPAQGASARSAHSPRGIYDPEQTRRRLYEASIKLFGQQGFAGTSVQEITSAAGVTKGAFYHHFDSKEDLLKLIHDEFVDHELAAMRRVLATEDDPSRQLRQILSEFMRSVELYQLNVSVFYQERRALTGDLFAAVKDKRDEFDRIFVGVIRAGQEKRTFRDDVDPRVVAFGILGMCALTHQWFDPHGSMSSEQIAHQFSNVVLQGLAIG